MQGTEYAIGEQHSLNFALAKRIFGMSEQGGIVSSDVPARQNSLQLTQRVFKSFPRCNVIKSTWFQMRQKVKAQLNDIVGQEKWVVG